MLRERFDMPLAPFVAAQREVFDPLIAAINDAPAQTAVDMWRRESASAVKRYLTRLERSGN
jgi:hypothetical protein